jgi:hypothetical protein
MLGSVVRNVPIDQVENSVSLEVLDEVIIDPVLQEIAERLRSIDPDNLSPRESQEVLYAMIDSLGKSKYSGLLEE